MKNIIYIGIGGYATTGKDLYYNIAKNMVSQIYTPVKISLADALKEELDPFCIKHYNISAFTTNSYEKRIIRPALVSHGCIMRVLTNGMYWIKKAEEKIQNLPTNSVVFVPDIRFENEVYWIHSNNGVVMHLTKFNKTSPDGGKTWKRVYTDPANTTEEDNDHIITTLANYKLDWEDLKVDINEPNQASYLKEKVHESLAALPKINFIL